LTSPNHDGLVRKTTVTEQEAVEIRRLVDLCNAHEGLDLKLTFEVAKSDAGGSPKAFLQYAGGALVGFCALDHDRGPEAEVCGMVDPAYRRQGIGRRLLAAAREACPPAGVTSLLLICEAASDSGQAFTRAVGGSPQFAEYHMEREDGDATSRSDPAGTTPLEIRRASRQDVDVVAHIMSSAFGDPEDSVRQRVLAEIEDARGPFYVAWREGTAIGSMKTYAMGPETGIYAFGVLPAYQGRGLGRAFLTQMMRLLRAQGPTRFVLEVHTDNAPAITVYRACGFTTTTTYGYYAVGI
jgi:mycothiol synthase